ncbi:MAG: hypothetical protein HQ574_03355 [Chloroflexi bacterium]|nr:hypothetical protein [Chloroflexota bacterium]
MKIQENREKWIKTLYKLRLQNLTATFLEALGPMNLLGAQLVYLSQPVLSPFISKEQSQDFAKVLEDPTETALLIKELRTYEPTA